jgi:uncharacterized tellurite resistance protein B-like protein
MWSAIRKLFGGDGGGPSAPRTPLDEARVCATTLLVEAALSDGVYAEIESEQIREIIQTTFGVDDAAAASILNEAEDNAETAADHHRFTNIVKRLPLVEREQLVESLWRVVYADGEETPEEEAMVRKLADLLHVDPRASRLARLKIAGSAPQEDASE